MSASGTQLGVGWWKLQMTNFVRYTLAERQLA